MAYLTGVVLFALIIFVSVCLHEAGHMLTAKAFGMKVTRYFAGFGPTLFSFKRGETEYGLKGIPLGGFVKIVGMTPQDDDVPAGEEHRAMWRYPVWKRTVVMSAGSATHFILGFVLLWITLSFVGVPNPAADPATLPATIGVQQCVVTTETQAGCTAADQPSPARAAGLRDGDTITSFNGAPVANYQDLVGLIRGAVPGGTAIIGYQRDGQPGTATVVLGSALRTPLSGSGPAITVAALGVGFQLPASVPTTVTYGPVRGTGKAVQFTGQTFVGVGQALKKFPEKVPNLWHALTGAPRDPNGPISVVGASRLGGESVQYGQWAFFLLIASSLNFFVGIFNLLPLLPLDGGHIAIAWFERARSWLYARLRRRDPGRVNYLKLMPVTYAVILIFGTLSLLTIAADIVNPVTIFGR